MKLVVLGAPGAGKGTQAHFLAEHFCVPHISTGALLREHIKGRTKIGLEVEALVGAGAFVSDEIVIRVLRERLGRSDCAGGFILDGFPRNVEQAKILDDVAGRLDKVVLIHIDDEEIVERIGGRRICSACEATWHLIYRPVKQEGICDLCGGKLIQRVDDKAKTVRERLRIYNIEEAPIRDYLDSAGLLVTVRGQEKIEDTTCCVIEAVLR